MNEVKQLKHDDLISYEEAVKIGVREAINYIKQQEYQKTTKRYDRRLRNTGLLLKNYRKLKIHNKETERSMKEIKHENAIDILDDIESINDEEQYIQSISRTKKRTNIILRHIDKMLKYYKAISECENDNKVRGYKIIYRLYIQQLGEREKTPTYESVAEEFNISERTVSRDVKEAIKDLSGLFFGIDGIKL